MRRILFIPILALLVTGITSCTEDELIDPAKVDLKFRMINPEPFDEAGGPPFEDELEFEAGTFQLASIEFDGQRENNDNHYFSREFSDLVVADLEEGTVSEPVSFEIPQGSYKHIRVTLHTGSSDTCSGLKFRGHYEFEFEDGLKKGNHRVNELDEIPIELCFFDQSEPIELTLETSSGDQQIVFNSDKWQTMEVTIDLAGIFRYFNPGKLRQAQIHGSGNQRRIIISSQHNHQIYLDLANRVERSMKAVVK